MFDWFHPHILLLQIIVYCVSSSLLAHFSKEFYTWLFWKKTSKFLHTDKNTLSKIFKINEITANVECIDCGKFAGRIGTKLKNIVKLHCVNHERNNFIRYPRIEKCCKIIKK